MKIFGGTKEFSFTFRGLTAKTWAHILRFLSEMHT
jgi:hypothetical protein